MSKKLFAPNGLKVVATAEIVPSSSAIQGAERAPDGLIVPDYTGSTEHHGDAQYTEINRGGELIYRDEEDNEWPGSMLHLEGEEPKPWDKEADPLWENDGRRLSARVELRPISVPEKFGGLSLTATAETEFNLDDDAPHKAWLEENATFAHRRACEFIVHIGTDADEEGSYYRNTLAELEEAGLIELIAVYREAKEAGAVRLLLYS